MFEHRFHHLRQPHLDSFGAGDHQRSRPAGELRVEQEKRQTAEMIAVKMRNQDEIDVSREIFWRLKAGSDEAPQSIRKLTRSPVA
jgi:hypothetical protein